MRRSTLAWLATMGLTAATAMALAAGANAAFPRLWIAALGAVSLVKGRLILLDFLELRGAGSWRQGIVAGFGAAIGLIFTGLLLG